MKIFDIKDVSDISYYLKKLDRNDLIECVRKMKEIKGSNKTQIARIIRMSRTVIERIWNK